jgi:hypothetical protein
VTLPRHLAAALAVVAALPLTAGCAVGFDAPTSVQGPSGNGASVDTGSLQARGLLRVGGDLPGRASLVGTVVNVAEEGDDAITAVAVQSSGSTPAAAAIVGEGATATIELPARSAVQIGYDDVRRIEVTGLTGGLGRYAEVTITYRAGGTATVPVLTVPAAGMYEGLGPVGPATG